MIGFVAIQRPMGGRSGLPPEAPNRPMFTAGGFTVEIGRENNR
jgi:hypothetical protein